MSEEEVDTGFISGLEKETQRMSEMPKHEFCKYLIDCSGKDFDCFHPYKTEGCHNYKEFEGL